MKKGIWKNKRYPGEFTGSYEWFCGERIFELTAKPPRTRKVTFESHEAAKGLGWRKFGLKQLPKGKRK